jgi:AcrR family transcriptional regulator
MISDPPAKSATTRRAPVTREQLLSAALRLTGPSRSVSTLTLREVAREAGVAPNSFYRHFRDVDALATALIEQAGQSLRSIVWEARSKVGQSGSLIRASVKTFMQQLHSGDQHLPLLLREGTAASAGFKAAVEAQLQFFESELTTDLKRLVAEQGQQLPRPDLVARAITRLVFAMGGQALAAPDEQLPILIEETSEMIRMIMRGALQSAVSAS